jgi:transcriptional regulator with XRE-family HTH domain
MSIDIGEKIKNLRISNGMSQNTLAKKAGIAQSTLSYVENGCKQPKFETLQSVCQGLGISVFELLAYNEIASMTEKLKTENLVVQPEHGKAEEDIGQSLYEGFLIKQQ